MVAPSEEISTISIDNEDQLLMSWNWYFPSRDNLSKIPVVKTGEYNGYSSIWTEKFIILSWFESSKPDFFEFSELTGEERSSSSCSSIEYNWISVDRCVTTNQKKTIETINKLKEASCENVSIIEYKYCINIADKWECEKSKVGWYNACMDQFEKRIKQEQSDIDTLLSHTGLYIGDYYKEIDGQDAGGLWFTVPVYNNSTKITYSIKTYPWWTGTTQIDGRNLNSEWTVEFNDSEINDNEIPWLKYQLDAVKDLINIIEKI